MGYDCVRVTAETLRRGGAEGSHWRSRIGHHMGLALDVVGFTFRATAAIRNIRDPDRVVITHNDALGGDVYVNHGLHKALIAERGWRAVLRNPLHLFLLIREEARHRLGLYRIAVCLSGTERQRLERFYRLKRPVRVIPNGVDITRFVPLGDRARDLARSDWKLTSRDFVLVFVGHEFERKGLLHVLRAMCLMPSNVRLWVVGGTPKASSAGRAQASSMGLSNRVTFFGTRSDIAMFLQRADALVLLSSLEASPLVVLEAMACGLPCLLSEGAASGDVLRPKENGLLVTSDEELVQMVEALLRDGDLRRVMSSHARQTAEALAWQHIARRYERLILDTWLAKRGTA